MPNRTKKGNVTAQARKKSAALSGGRFPIFDEQSANAAIKLRGHAKPGEQAAIINKAASYAPAAAAKARKKQPTKKK